MGYIVDRGDGIATRWDIVDSSSCSSEQLVLPTRELAEAVLHQRQTTFAHLHAYKLGRVVASSLPVCNETQLKTAAIAYQLPGLADAANYKEDTDYETYGIRAVAPDKNNGYWLDVDGKFEGIIVAMTHTIAEKLASALKAQGRSVEVRSYDAPVTSDHILDTLFNMYSIKEQPMRSNIYRYAVIEKSTDEKKPDTIIQDFKTAIAEGVEQLKNRVLITEVPNLKVENIDNIKIVITEAQTII
jgi:hypothetical protein